MKKTLLLLFLPFFSLVINSQNLLHYATSTNGQKGECLFPEDANGEVTFSKIIEVPSSADTIMTLVDEYINSRSISDKYEIKRIFKSERSAAYEIQINIGKQSWGLEFRGTPLFVREKDASHIKFKCIVGTSQGKFKYTLTDFETNRNTIRGEAKNDGQPNTIHWQRVNSLIKERDSYANTHNLDKRSVKEEIFDYNSQISYEAILYLAEYESVQEFIKGIESIDINNEFLNVQFNEETASEKKLNGHALSNKYALSISNVGFYNLSILLNKDSQTSKEQQPLDLTNFKGFLMDIGNNVFIISGEKPYEQAGAHELMKQIMIDGYWNVVNDPGQAHFIIEYVVDLKGADKASINLLDYKGNTICEAYGDTWRTNESVKTNKKTARDMYLNQLLPLVKKIQKKKYPKDLGGFLLK